MKSWLALALCTALLSTAARAQTGLRGVCGTDDVDIEITKANILAAEAFAKTHPAQARGATRYFPIRFKVTGRTDGTGETQVYSLVSSIEAINRDFAPYNWQFYLQDIEGTPFDYFFRDDLSARLSQDPAFIEANRELNAITIYATADASTPNSDSVGVTLGYYSPRQDILVMRSSEIGPDAATATHELGHYFSLPHTFRGFDCVTWTGAVCSDTSYSSPVTELTGPCRIGGRDIPVELVTRGEGANCATAGDLFCDTPADYNLGFGYRSCRYNGPVKDRNGESLAPQENNFMSYFQDCRPYQFTEQQFAAMSADVRSRRRNFLSATAAPINIDTVRLSPTPLSPLNGATTDFSDEVSLAWGPVSGALYYYVEVNSGRDFSDLNSVTQTIVPATQTTFLQKGLKANKNYWYRVTAFNQLTVGLPATGTRFRTGTLSSTRAREAVGSFTVYPNPKGQNAELSAAFETEASGTFEISLLDITGRVLATERVYLDEGSNRMPLTGATQLAAGNYIARVSGEAGVSTRRFVVQ